MDLPQPLVGDLLLGNAVLLDLQEIVLGPKDVPVLGGGAPALFQAALADEVRDLAAQAAGERDEAVVVLDEQLLVHPRLVVEAFQVGLAGEREEVLVAGPVRSQQDQMVVLVVGELPFPIEPALWGEVGLAADDRLDAGGGGVLGNLAGPAEVALVGGGQ